MHVANQLEVRQVQQMGDIRLLAGEEVVQTEIVAEHECALLLGALDQWLDFGLDWSADAEDAIVAMLVG